MKKTIYLLAVLSLLIACNNDDAGATGETFDHTAQAKKDAEYLVTYLKTHYYIPPVDDEYFGKIDTITDGLNVTSLFDDPKLEEHTVSFTDIDYKMYTYEQAKGSQDLYASKVDSTLVRYKGELTTKATQFDVSDIFNWWALYNVSSSITGFRNGLTHFTGGENISEDGKPIDFKNTGKGFMIFPSGLGYRNSVRGKKGEYRYIPANSPLVFHIDMGYVIIADNDNDGILNINEDIDKDGEAYNDDSDGDRNPDYVDIDDDNDGVLTRDEDIDGDGNPMNDDTDNDGIKNYLDTDDDGDGKPTAKESKTNDADNDGVVDYLDPDTK